MEVQLDPTSKAGDASDEIMPKKDSSAILEVSGANNEDGLSDPCYKMLSRNVPILEIREVPSISSDARVSTEEERVHQKWPKRSTTFSPNFHNDDFDSFALQAFPGFKVHSDTSYKSLLEKAPRSYLSSIPTSLYNSWFWECMSLVISLATFAALIVLLINYDQKPLPSWSLTTIVAIFATCIKAAMMVPVSVGIRQFKWLWFRTDPQSLNAMDQLDSASRGHKAALELLWKTKGRLVFLIIVRNLVSLGALIAASTVAIDSCIQESLSYESKSVPTARTFINKLNMKAAGSIHSPHVQSDVLSSQIAAASYHGLLLSPVQMTTDCPTANCSWSNFLSLAICSYCQDISEKITTNTSSGIISLPMGLTAGSHDYKGRPLLEYSSTLDRLSEFNPTYTVLNLTVLLNQEAFECALYFCIHEYEASVTDGNLTDVVVKTWDSPSDGISRSDDYYLFNLSEEESGGLPDSEFLISNLSLRTVANKFNEIFDGLFISTDMAADGFVPTALDGSVGYANGLNTTQSLTHIPQLMADVSQSATNTLRQSSYAVQVSGQAYKNKVFVVVCWSWLSVPAGLLTLTSIFLIATIHQSKKHGIKPWKTSATALLFHGLAEEHRNKYANVDEPAAMEEVAEKLHVQLRETEDGWRLV